MIVHTFQLCGGRIWCRGYLKLLSKWYILSSLGLGVGEMSLLLFVQGLFTAAVGDELACIVLSEVLMSCLVRLCKLL